MTGAGQNAAISRGALARRVWEIISGSAADVAAGRGDGAAVLAAALDGARAARLLLRSEDECRRRALLRGITFRRTLERARSLEAAQRMRLAARLADHHPAVRPGLIAAAMGVHVGLARIVPAAADDARRFEMDAQAGDWSDDERPPGAAALIIAPGFPRPADLVALALNSGAVRFFESAGPFAPGPRSALARRADARWRFHVCPVAWLMARCRAHTSGAGADAAAGLIADVTAVDWTRRGDLGAATRLEIPGAGPDDARVRAIWQALSPRLRRKVTIFTQAAGDGGRADPSRRPCGPPQDEAMDENMEDGR